ncbi:GNAT family N-acetyltransferase [Jhaorihella thermophila]|uniref:Acetyltransferase (GNAT) family protein n=1 Tax=Jhaorihella thermophila TaxID=488547 RepID=A0A1H5SQD8_9RHOB|nr:GNAT family N-acetyltransferase [Jhaorihella thermophila]SEF52178.1 Acetyltransferase (GNAT) family protein [Jhaorihella thermophila]
MTALHLAGPNDLDRLAALSAAFHAETGIEQADDVRRAALLPLLEGSPHGCAYLIGPARAPIGYIVITFGWSVEFGGLDGFIDEIYLRPAVRGRGIATEVLAGLPRALGQAGVRALHLEVDRDNAAAQRLYARAGFAPRDRCILMTRVL